MGHSRVDQFRDVRTQVHAGGFKLVPLRSNSGLGLWLLEESCRRALPDKLAG
jgi:hypothetical protein